MLRLTLARLLLREGRIEAALEHAESAVRLDPEFTAAWKELGQQRQLAGLADAAVAAWQHGVEVARSNGDKQAEKEMTVFLKRLLKAREARHEPSAGSD